MIKGPAVAIYGPMSADVFIAIGKAFVGAMMIFIPKPNQP